MNELRGGSTINGQPRCASWITKECLGVECPAFKFISKGQPISPELADALCARNNAAPVKPTAPRALRKR